MQASAKKRGVKRHEAIYGAQTSQPIYSQVQVAISAQCCQVWDWPVNTPASAKQPLAALGGEVGLRQLLP